MITEKTPPTPEVGCHQIRVGDEIKKVKGQQFTQNANPSWIKDWKGYNKTMDNVDNSNSTAVDKVTNENQ